MNAAYSKRMDASASFTWQVDCFGRDDIPVRIVERPIPTTTKVSAVHAATQRKVRIHDAEAAAPDHFTPSPREIYTKVG